MQFLKPLLILSLFINLSLALTHFEVNCGEISVEGYNSCEISNENHTMVYKGPMQKTIPGLWFGLISYKCDNFASYLVSVFDCKGCNFYCSYEEYADDCLKDDAPFWIGVFSGILVTGVIGGLAFRYLQKVLIENLPRVNFFWQANKGQDIREPVLATPIEHSDGTLDGNIIDNDVQNVFTVQQEKLDRLTQKCGEGGKISSTSAQTARPTSSNKTTLSSLLISILLLKSAGACDVTLVTKSGNLTMLCMSHRCRTTPFPSISIGKGRTICIKDHSGEQMFLTPVAVTVRSIYKMQYYTSDYKVVDVATRSAVCSTCVNGLTRSDCYNEFTKSSIEEQGDKVHNFHGCKYLNYALDSVVCAHFWNKERLGELYPIYMFADQFWVVDFTLKHGYHTRRMRVTSQDPFLTRTRYTLDKQADLFLTAALEEVTSFTRKFNALLSYKDTVYQINASEVNEPEANKFGDFQVALRKDKITFPEVEGNVQRLCEATLNYGKSSCNCSAGVGKSMINNFASKQEEFEQAEKYQFRKSDHSVLELNQKLDEANIELRFGDWKIEYLATKNAVCDIEFLTSYGSDSLEEMSHVYLHTQNITTEGLVPFYSNCSFDKQFVSCDYEPTKLILMSKDRSCFIDMPTLNKTILFTIEYSDLSRRYELVKKDSNHCKIILNSYSEALGHLWNNEQFTRTFASTVIISSIVSLVVTFIIVVISSPKRRQKNQQETILEL